MLTTLGHQIMLVVLTLEESAHIKAKSLRNSLIIINWFNSTKSNCNETNTISHLKNNIKFL